MKAVFTGINPGGNHEMIVEVIESKINFKIHDATDEQSAANLDINFDDAAELIRFLQEKMKKK